MLTLNETGLKNRKEWEDAGYTLPRFDRSLVAARTKEAPYWIHFGAGNIFRAFQANVVQKLLNEKILDRGLIAAEGFDYEIIEKINRPHDDYSILVTLKANGSIEKTVVGSVVESLLLDSCAADFDRLKTLFEQETLQLASFTITEKGYSLAGGNGDMLPAVAEDMAAGPKKPVSYIGKITALLYTRYLAGEKPIAMVSMDNCSHNGTKLYNAVFAFAKKWGENGAVPAGFVDYINNEKKVSFPLSMIDKITPRPDPSVEKLLEADGLLNAAPLITRKNTYTAAFVNAEECEYLVIEDSFPNGRPPLEKGGIIFTRRETVDKVEKMKVCTCLNPLHTALAIFGCLLGYDLISKEMKDKDLKKLVEGIGYKEGLPVVINPGILNPEEFLSTVLEFRLPNPFMPDTPQRIATDTSQKLAIRFGETIKSYAASPALDPRGLKLIPLVFAGWLRYLMAVDDEGNAFSLSPDPMLESICPYVKKMALGNVTMEEAQKLLAPLLKNKDIWGVDLYELEMDTSVCKYFVQMCQGKGAVRKTLASL